MTSCQKASVHAGQISFVEMMEEAKDRVQQATRKEEGGLHIKSSAVKAGGVTGKI